MQLPSASCKRILDRAVLGLLAAADRGGAAMVHCCCKTASSVLGWSVIWEKSVTSFWCSHLKICFGAELRLPQPQGTPSGGSTSGPTGRSCLPPPQRAPPHPLYSINQNYVESFSKMIQKSRRCRSWCVAKTACQKHRPAHRGVDFRRYDVETGVALQKRFDLRLVFLPMHCTGRIHQTAVFGKRICAILQNFLLDCAQFPDPVQIFVPDVRLFGDDAKPRTRHVAQHAVKLAQRRVGIVASFWIACAQVTPQRSNAFCSSGTRPARPRR